MGMREFLVWVIAWGACLSAFAQAPQVFRECDDCPQMVVLPAGSFTMGSPSHEAGRYDNEGPQRLVTIPRPFAAGRYEVTRGQFAAFVADSGYQSQAIKLPRPVPVFEAQYRIHSPHN